MAPEAFGPHICQRRWNAAVLQRYLKRRALAAFCMHLRDLQAVAGDLEPELCGTTNSLDLLQQAWEHLILTGLVTADPMPDEDYSWRLSDASPAPSLVSSGARAWQ